MNDSIDGPSTKLAALAVSIVVGAFFAAVDEAVGALGAARARAARDGGGPDGEAAGRFLDHEAAVQTRLLVGRILSLVTAVVLSYDIALQVSGIVPRAILMMGVALVYAAAVGIASTLASRRASGVALYLFRLWRPLELLVALPSAPLIWASQLVDKLYPPRPEHDPELVTQTVVEHMIEQGEEQGSINEEDAELLRSVIEFGDTIAREIMVPRTSMVAIEIGTSLPDVVKLIVEKGHSRYPVYRERIDQLEGVLYAKDLFSLLGNGGEGTLADMIRKPVFFAAESQKISELLRQMQARRVHLAIVADEYGGTSGMVTLEDIIEEIVGEIRDEHDHEEAAIRRLAPGRFMVDADVSVYDLAKATGLVLPEGEFDSLGGMITTLAGRVLAVGESVAVGGHDLVVCAADERHVQRVEVVHRQSIAGAAE
ncbi:MAG: hemolysin family protein [Myxococcales bacterium]|nr:hemolysin family protein [Myxococcales bacterium]MDD9967232.1 hemolysin family protein [Myxococcales bacterium]